MGCLLLLGLPLRLQLVLVHQIDRFLPQERLRFQQRFRARSLRGGLFGAAKSEVLRHYAFDSGGKLFFVDGFSFGLARNRPV